MKDSTTMTFDELKALRTSVNAAVAKWRSEIDTLTERGRKAKAALTKALVAAAPAPIPAEEGERLEAMMCDLRAARTVEIGTAHADGRKPVTTKLDKAISQAEADLAAYQAKLEAAKEAEPAFEEKRAAACARHAAEVTEINAKVATAKRAIAAQERLLAEGALRYACHAALAASNDEMVADRLQCRGDKQSETAGRMEDMFKGSAFSDLARHFEKDAAALRRRDTELERLASSGLDVSKPFASRSIPTGPTHLARTVPQGPRLIESEPTDSRDRRYMHAGVFTADGRRIN
ncbi:hypothetical protein [Paraburkholderia aspalathi]|uniref:Uncharacterized protein n=1 Tax=Paraburkholderia aspalathi TaxID=1324617 RepID=A0A1I7EGW5_9BURK|nr:hypothetical protein [Paraburkholderia aspalathi]SFU23161.1 hypothetical protein SAMN05192563_102042 [Paraburkholderia aspalathi]